MSDLIVNGRHNVGRDYGLDAAPNSSFLKGPSNHDGCRKRAEKMH